MLGARALRQLCSSRVPTVFTEDGYRFFFYGSDHRPHSWSRAQGNGEGVFAVEHAVELMESAGFKLRELRRAQAEEHRDAIFAKWHEHFG